MEARAMRRTGEGAGPSRWLPATLGLLVLIAGRPVEARPSLPPAEASEAAPARSFGEIAGESLFGDAYAEPSAWRPLSLRTFFTEGWDEPWVGAPSGTGGAPRQGWINALDGVFFRLYFADFTFQANYHHDGNRYLGSYTIFTPVSRRFQLRFDVPFLDSTKGGASNTYHGNFGDFAVTPRFLLSETRDLTQLATMTIRMPTGKPDNGNGVAGLLPQYEFWYNFNRGWVVRGGAGLAIPTNNVGARTAMVANLSIGQYLTPHDRLPFGDLVWYLGGNIRTPLDRRGPPSTYFSLTPGFRTHLGRDWYLLGAVEVPLTGPKTFDWSPIVWLMKVY